MCVPSGDHEGQASWKEVPEADRTRSSVPSARTTWTRNRSEPRAPSTVWYAICDPSGDHAAPPESQLPSNKPLPRTPSGRAPDPSTAVTYSSAVPPPNLRTRSSRPSGGRHTGSAASKPRSRTRDPLPSESSDERDLRSVQREGRAVLATRTVEQHARRAVGLGHVQRIVRAERDHAVGSGTERTWQAPMRSDEGDRQREEQERHHSQGEHRLELRPSRSQLIRGPSGSLRCCRPNECHSVALQTSRALNSCH
jgi:hypothetical protein